MKDSRGQEIGLGDLVVYSYQGYVAPCFGKVVGFTSAKVKIAIFEVDAKNDYVFTYKRDNVRKPYILKWPSDLVDVSHPFDIRCCD